ncbi:MAG: DUF47 family protein [Halanaerobiales bacterium]|nr:DUF47 family protein [Halanaerobiales bacterium]
MKKSIFNKSKELEKDINEYLDNVEEALLIFKRDINRYFDGHYDLFEESLDDILEIENKADKLLKDIKYKLYTYMLIPEARGDVLTLLETMDNEVDLCKKVLMQFSIEKPEIREFVLAEFKDLTKQSLSSAEEVVKGIRTYFEEISMVNDYVNKVNFYEHEADKIEERIKRKVFQTDEIDEFSKRVHLRHFSERIAYFSDLAEEISEKLSVAAIKRSI